MRKFKVYFITFLLVFAFTGMSEYLFCARNIIGQGNAVWGDSMAKTMKRFSRRDRQKEVNVTQAGSAIIINYRRGTVLRKKYEFRNGGLYRISLTYSYGARRIVNNYNKKYALYSTFENGTYIWYFPSTVITVKQGKSKAIFTDARYYNKTSRSNNIDQVRVGMTTQQVREIMGTPGATATATGNITTYRYKTGLITFQYGQVIKIEKGIITSSQTVTPSTTGNIGAVKIGMVPSQVTAIMGNPLATQSFGSITLFKYTTGVVSFKNGQVVKVETYSVQKKVIKKR